MLLQMVCRFPQLVSQMLIPLPTNDQIRAGHTSHPQFVLAHVEQLQQSHGRAGQIPMDDRFRHVYAHTYSEGTERAGSSMDAIAFPASPFWLSPAQLVAHHTLPPAGLIWDCMQYI